MKTVQEINQEYTNVCAQVGDLVFRIYKALDLQTRLELEMAKASEIEEALKKANEKPAEEVKSEDNKD